MDEIDVRVNGQSSYLYRAIDSSGATIDFLLCTHRDAHAARRFFQKALTADRPRPRVINVGVIKVDGNPLTRRS